MSTRAKLIAMLDARDNEKARKVAYLHAYFEHLHEMHLDGCDDLDKLIEQAHAEEGEALRLFQKRRLELFTPTNPKPQLLRNDLHWLKI